MSKSLKANPYLDGTVSAEAYSRLSRVLHLCGTAGDDPSAPRPSADDAHRLKPHMCVRRQKLAKALRHVKHFAVLETMPQPKLAQALSDAVTDDSDEKLKAVTKEAAATLKELNTV